MRDSTVQALSEQCLRNAFDEQITITLRYIQN